MADAIANGSQWASVITTVSLGSRSDLSTNFREAQDELQRRTFAARPLSARHDFYSSFATCGRAFSPNGLTTLCALHQADLKHLANRLIMYSRKRACEPQTIVGQSNDRKPVRCARLNMHRFTYENSAHCCDRDAATIRRYCNRTQVVLVLPHTSSKFKTAGIPLKLNT
jgi:hypothetical protein